MRKKKTFEYTSYFAAEFNGFLQYRKELVAWLGLIVTILILVDGFLQ